MVLVGDVKDRVAIIVDDMADTCGTLVKAADVVMEHGAREAIAIVTHGILSGNAVEKLNESKLKTLVVTNTVPHEEKKKRCSRIETLDISPTVSKTSLISNASHILTAVADRGMPENAQWRECFFPVQACAVRLDVMSYEPTNEVFLALRYFTGLANTPFTAIASPSSL